MKIILSLEHPAWVHQFKYIVDNLKQQGHEVKIVAINKDVTIDLLGAYNIPYEMISESSGKTVLEKGLIFLKTTWNIFKICLTSKPDMFIGRASPMMAINSFLFRKPHIVFEDSEPSRFCLFLCRMFSDAIITPECFTTDLGRKQIRIAANKELFYLHPRYFRPDPRILELMHLEREDRFAILRFVAWNAHHDIGQHGIRDKIGFEKRLESLSRLYITSEDTLPDDLIGYQITIPPERIHEILYFAALFFSDSQTMTTEAALLGTPAVRCNSFVGKNDMGNFVELEEHGLVVNCRSEEEGIDVATSILNAPDSKIEWTKRRDSLMEEKIDATAFMTWFIENYPRSFVAMKEHPEVQYSCTR